MFHWICPECGREIPPAVRECPACDPQSEQKTHEETAAVAAQPPEPVPASPVPPEQLVLRNEPEPEIALPDLLLELAQQIRAAQRAGAVTPGLVDLAAAVGVTEAPTLDVIAIPVEASAAKPEPIPVAVATPAPAAVEQARQPIALLAPPMPEIVPEVAPEVAPEPAPEVTPEPGPVALAEPVPAVLPSPAAPVRSGDAAKVAAAPLVQPMPPPPVPETPAEKPPSGSWLRLAPLQDYSAAASRGMHPAVPLPKILTPDSGPRITLPGPLLPPELRARQDLHVVTVLGQRRNRTGVPGWLVSLIVMIGLLGAGILAVLYFLPASHTTADAKAPAPEPETPVVAAEPSHPLAEFVEVTGFRFIMDLNKKSEVHYLVVNHSAVELTDMTVYVTVKSANAKPGQPPLCRFSFRSPGLGPFESKEMISSIEKLSRPVALPDWHDLRAEVQISQ